NGRGGIIAGVGLWGGDLGSKQLGLLHEVAPQSTRFGVLLNPTTRSDTRRIAELQAAAAAIGKQIEVRTARTNDKLDAAFASLVELTHCSSALTASLPTAASSSLRLQHTIGCPPSTRSGSFQKSAE